jgi:predicted nuclease of predicted toxin-antitoxin system
MYDGLDDDLKKHGYPETESVKKLINSGKNLRSDFSVLNYARDNRMILITVDVENKKGCDENSMQCITISKNSVLELVLNELEKFKK